MYKLECLRGGGNVNKETMLDASDESKTDRSPTTSMSVPSNGDMTMTDGPKKGVLM